MRGSTIFVSLLVLMFVLIDFNERFLVEQSNNNNTFEPRWNDTQLLAPQLTAKQKADLELASTSNSAVNDAAAAIAGLSLEQQKLQTGVLKQLFIGDWLYQLIAIVYPEGFKQLEPFALLQATNIKDNTTKVEKISHNSSLYEYEVKINDTKQVKFFDKESGRSIALTMYKITPVPKVDSVN